MSLAGDALVAMVEQLNELTGAGAGAVPELEAVDCLALVNLPDLCRIVDSLGSEVPDWVQAQADMVAGLRSELELDAVARAVDPIANPAREVRFAASLMVPESLLEADMSAGPVAVDWLLGQLGPSLADFVILEDDDQ